MGQVNTVLVVDDADVVRTMLVFMLEKAGYNILSSADGAEALEYFDGRDIDLVITDLNMPEMNGDKLITEVRSKDYYKYIPIVLFIPEDNKDKQHFGSASGASITFDKDNIKEKMIHTVKMLIG